MADFTETRLGKIFIKSIAAGFVALMVSSILFGAANFVLELLLDYDGPWKTAICVTCAAFLPWYMFLNEVDNRPKKGGLLNFQKTTKVAKEPEVLDDETDWKIKKLNWENNVLKAELEKLKRND